MKNDTNSRSFSVTGIGVLTALGSSVEEVWTAAVDSKTLPSGRDYALKNTNVAPFLRDRRMLKAVSQRDGVGLAAVEQLKKEVNYEKLNVDSYRRAMYVGACPSTVDDNDNYLEAVLRSKEEGLGEKGFGKHCMDARPTTLLMGLPNNVLCYGSIILEAKGPNNNFTNAEISSLICVHTAMRNLRRGRVDIAICGGYSSSTDDFSLQILNGRGDLDARYGDSSLLANPKCESGTIPADAGVFIALERESSALERGQGSWGKVLGTAIASATAGPSDLQVRSDDSRVIVDMMKRCMSDAGLSEDLPDIIFVSASGIDRVDVPEVQACRDLLANANITVPVLSAGNVTKNLQEASGLLEIGLSKMILESGILPKSLRVEGFDADVIRSDAAKRVMIIRSSGFGEFAAMLCQVDGGVV